MLYKNHFRNQAVALPLCEFRLHCRRSAFTRVSFGRESRVIATQLRYVAKHARPKPGRVASKGAAPAASTQNALRPTFAANDSCNFCGHAFGMMNPTAHGHRHSSIETIPRHLGNAVQPQKACRALLPRFAARHTIDAPQRGQNGFERFSATGFPAAKTATVFASEA